MTPIEGGAGQRLELGRGLGMKRRVMKGPVVGGMRYRRNNLVKLILVFGLLICLYVKSLLLLSTRDYRNLFGIQSLTLILI